MIGVVFSKSTGRLRRVICTDGVLDWRAHPLHAGEESFQFDVGAISAAEVEFLIEQYRGVPTDTRNCAVVERGVITNLIVADPEIDKIKGATLVLVSPDAKIGDPCPQR